MYFKGGYDRIASGLNVGYKENVVSRMTLRFGLGHKMDIVIFVLF